jgi:hypothetical protein
MREAGPGAGTLGLGMWLVVRRGLVVVALVLAGIGAIAAAAVALSSRGGAAAAAVPTHASVVIAWSAGVMVAFAGALRAIPSDADEGVLALLRARGVPVASYVRGRVSGLVAVLALAVGGAVAVADAATLSVARPVMPAAQACAGALLYALAFSATLGPLAMAALGARSRAAGYLAFLFVLVLPEVAARWTSTLLPRGWHELSSIPAALQAVQDGVLAPGTAGFAMARAIAALATLTVLSIAVVHMRIPRIEGGGAA